MYKEYDQVEDDFRDSVVHAGAGPGRHEAMKDDALYQYWLHGL